MSLRPRSVPIHVDPLETEQPVAPPDRVVHPSRLRRREIRFGWRAGAGLRGKTCHAFEVREAVSNPKTRRAGQGPNLSSAPDRLCIGESSASILHLVSNSRQGIRIPHSVALHQGQMDLIWLDRDRERLRRRRISTAVRSSAIVFEPDRHCSRTPFAGSGGVGKCTCRRVNRR